VARRHALTEDKEWSLYWLERGYVCVVDPRLRVAHSHTSDPTRKQFRRARLEWVGLGMFMAVDPYPLSQAAREWWTERETYPTRLRSRLAPKRMARLAGKWAGRRRPRAPSPAPPSSPTSSPPSPRPSSRARSASSTGSVTAC